MVPTRYDYYKARIREHRRLASSAANVESRAMHEQLVAAYRELARACSLKQIVTLRPTSAAYEKPGCRTIRAGNRWRRAGGHL